MLDISLLWPHTYEKQSKEEGFILLMVSVHHGEEGSVDQSGSYHGSQEGERERENACTLFPLFIPPRLQSMGWCHLHSGQVFPLS
jgi:hypothetical protein